MARSPLTTTTSLPQWEHAPSAPAVVAAPAVVVEVVVRVVARVDPVAPADLAPAVPRDRSQFLTLEQAARAFSSRHSWWSSVVYRSRPVGAPARSSRVEHQTSADWRAGHRDGVTTPCGK